MDQCWIYELHVLCFCFQTVRTFFRTNKGTCLEWLSRIRSSVIKIALHSGMPAMAVRQCHQLLQEMKDNNTVQVTNDKSLNINDN